MPTYLILSKIIQTFFDQCSVLFHPPQVIFNKERLFPIYFLLTDPNLIDVAEFFQYLDYSKKIHQI